MKSRALLYLIPLLFSCGGASQEKSKEDIPIHNYSEVADRMIDWYSSLSQKDNKYYVYCYSNICKYCDEIKNEVIDISLKHKKNIYFCNSNIRIEELDPSATIGMSNIEDLYIRGFPSLIEVNNAIVMNNTVGKSKVIEILRN